MLVTKSPLRHRIAVVEIHGAIGGAVKSAALEPTFNAILKDRRYRALVLDIDSPGGGVSASDYIYRAVAKIAEQKPVIAAIRGTGTSGAYMISCAAHRIVATPGAIVGSIGVISVRPVLQELLQKAGIRVNVNKSGQYKDMGAMWRTSTPEEEQKMQELIDDSYGDFVSLVAKARKMDEEQVRAFATGEVFWATKAKELGLVDELGDLERAIDIAAEQANAPRKPVHIGPRKGILSRLLSPAAETFVDSIASEVERRLWMGSLR